MSLSLFDPVSVAVATISNDGPVIALIPAASTAKKQPLHRIRAVRQEQGVSSSRAAQRLGISRDQLRHDERPDADLMLTQLYEWQRVLEVPASDLLVEPESWLSAPVLRRVQLLRLMKTARSIVERSNQPSVHRLAQTMVGELIEIMPELDGVMPWHSLDRRTRDQNSRVSELDYLATPPSDSH